MTAYPNLTRTSLSLLSRSLFHLCMRAHITYININIWSEAFWTVKSTLPVFVYFYVCNFQVFTLKKKKNLPPHFLSLLPLLSIICHVFLYQMSYFSLWIDGLDLNLYLYKCVKQITSVNC